MRLAGFCAAQNISELDSICQQLDTHGLSAISAPTHIQEITDEECQLVGEKAQKLDIIIGETGMWENLMTSNKNIQGRRIQQVRSLLQKADKMQYKTVVTLVGSLVNSNHPLAPHPGNYQATFKKAFREVVLRILDGLDLPYTIYSLEPWHNTFFINRKRSIAF